MLWPALLDVGPAVHGPNSRARGRRLSPPAPLFCGAAGPYLKEINCICSFIRTGCWAQVRAIRGGREQAVPVRDVLVGDLLLVEAGDILCADGMLVAGSELK